MEQKKSFRNKDANNNPVLALIIGLFLLAAAAGLFILKTKNPGSENETILIIAMIALLVIGAYITVFAIVRFVVLHNLKLLRDDPNAKTATAKFVKLRYSSVTGSETGVGKVPLKANAYVFTKVFYEYTDDGGITHTAKSVVSYTLNQANYLKEKGTFKIKYKGKLTWIMEDTPEIEKSFDFNLIKGEVKVNSGSTKKEEE